MMIYLLILFLCTHTAFYVIIFSRLIFYKSEIEKSINVQEPITILACYHNEAPIAQRSTELLKAQKKPIIAVDDNSNDGTTEILSSNVKSPHTFIKIREQTDGKKYALQEGIKSSKSNRILLTDADCIPATEHWAEKMNTFSSSFVLGYGPMIKRKSMVGLFSRYETYLTAIQYLSYALQGMPYMGVGRNMRMEKELYLAEKNKIQGQQLASGDDDLMVSALANEENTRICIDPDTFVYSEPKSTWNAFFRQKARHISTSSYYRPFIKGLLFCFSASQIAFYLIAILGVISGTLPWELAIIAVGIKWVLQWIIGFPLMRKLKEEDLFFSIPLLDVVHAIYLLILPLVVLKMKNRNHWS